MIQRVTLYALLAVVATAAAVLSFSALRDLALVCGFDAALAPLLPVVIDAGAAAGSLVWLGSAAPTARGKGRTLATVLLVVSVASNALSHALEAYRVAPPWWVVVVVSAIAPAVLWAVVHLLVVAVRPAAAAVLLQLPPAEPSPAAPSAARLEDPAPPTTPVQVVTVESREARATGRGGPAAGTRPPTACCAAPSWWRSVRAIASS